MKIKLISVMYYYMYKFSLETEILIKYYFKVVVLVNVTSPLQIRRWSLGEDLGVLL